MKNESIIKCNLVSRRYESGRRDVVSPLGSAFHCNHCPDYRAPCLLVMVYGRQRFHLVQHLACVLQEVVLYRHNVHQGVVFDWWCKPFYYRLQVGQPVLRVVGVEQAEGGTVA